MSKELNNQIEKLITNVENNKLITVDAIKTLCDLLSTFHSDTYYTGEIEDPSLSESLPEYCNDLIEKNNLIKKRIQKLERILLLQELGVKFTKDELKGVLGN